MTNAERNPVAFIQEFCQKHAVAFPRYEDLDSSGPPHCPMFTVRCSFEGNSTTGMSRQKKQAKTEAASAMVALLTENNYFTNQNETNNPTTTESKNPISLLNEFCQRGLLAPPQFVEKSVAGTFVCECKVRDKTTQGSGINKKSAKTEAAFKMCQALNIRTQIPLTTEESHGESQTEESHGESQTEESHGESQTKDLNILKNPISLLQEYCQQNTDDTSLADLGYTELRKESNLSPFGIECSLGSISCVGRGETKKAAKAQAASLVLMELLAQGKTLPGKNSGPSGLPVESVIKKFDIESSSEDEDQQNDKNNSSEVTDKVASQLETLSLNQQSEKKTEEEAKEVEEDPVDSSHQN